MQSTRLNLSGSEAAAKSQSGGSERIVALDSLRGVASLLVLASHIILMQNLDGRSGDIIQHAGHLMGKVSVLVFFVLSGFVLMRTFITGKTNQYIPYAIKRVIRIWPPFAVSILISCLLYVLVSPTNIPELSTWFNWNWRFPPSFDSIARHLLMTDITDWQTYNVVMWSLVYEMRISLIFPLLVYAINRDWRIAFIGSFVISAISMVFFRRFGLTFDPFSALRYLWLFAAGAIMACNYQFLIAWFNQQRLAYRLLAWAAVLALLVVSLERIENATTPLAALLIVFLCFADRPADRFLSRSVLRWFGEISYSLYLLHIPILLALTHLLYHKVSMPVLTALIVGTSLLASHVMYHAIERPSIALGRTLARRATSGREVRSALPRA
ncbi:acyltransferase family protein [Methylobacterium oryzihabitans]|nr:acyltransferase [Methylobacterium oryzihabitans]